MAPTENTEANDHDDRLGVKFDRIPRALYIIKDCHGELVHSFLIKRVFPPFFTPRAVVDRGVL